MAGQPTAGMHWWTAATAAPLKRVREVLGRLGPAESPGGFGHPCKHVHESGTAVYAGSGSKLQPIVLNAPGEVCETWSKELAKWSCELGAWCTRLDLALDVEPAAQARSRLLQLRRDFRAGRCQTSMRRTSMLWYQGEGEGDGCTLYLGGKTAELRVRIYDRRGPLRIEPQWRPSRSMGQVVPELLVNKGATHLWRALAKRVEFQQPWYQKLLAGDLAEVTTDPRTDSLFADVVAQLQKQFGMTLWAFQLLGVGLDDLARDPIELKGSQAAKLLAWAKSAEGLGYDGAKLRKEVRRRCEPS